MPMIAFRRMFYWFWDEVCDLFEDRWSLFTAGMIAIFVKFILQTFGQIGATRGGSQLILAIIVGKFLAESVLDAMLIGNAKARLHERSPGVADLMPDPLLVLHLGVARFLCIILTNLPILLIGAGAVARVLSGGPGSLVTAVSLSVGLVLAVLLSMFLWPLPMFVPYLIIDRRLHFLDAIRYSVSCVVRDYPGLLIFNVLWIIGWGMSFVIGSLCLPGLIIYLLTPALYTSMMRCYRDYFGLGHDWVLEEQLRQQGYHQMAGDVAAHEDSPYFVDPPTGGKR